MHPPNLAKSPLLATKCAKNEVFVGGLRFNKSTFGVQKVHFWEVPHPPDSILAMGLSIFLFFDSQVFIKTFASVHVRSLRMWKKSTTFLRYWQLELQHTMHYL